MGTVYRSAQLAELGISRHACRGLVKEGRLHPVERGIYCTAPPEGHLLLRALTVTRPHLVYSGPTARQIYDDLPVTTPAHGLVQRPHDYRSTDRLQISQVRVLAGRQVNALPVVSPVQAVAELAATDPTRARAFLEKHYAGRSGPVHLHTDLAALTRTPPALTALLATTSYGADSGSERKLFRALKKKGVILQQNHRLGHYHWDAAIPSARILIELDSHRFHAAAPAGENQRTFIIDRWKANDGARRGWLVLHYTGECVYRHVDLVVEQILDTIRWRTTGRQAPRSIPEPLPFEVSPPWKWHHDLRAVRVSDTWDEPPF